MGFYGLYHCSGNKDYNSHTKLRLIDVTGVKWGGVSSLPTVNGEKTVAVYKKEDF